MKDNVLEEIKKEIIESEISAHDLRVMLDIIRKYEPSMQNEVRKVDES